MEFDFTELAISKDGMTLTVSAELENGDGENFVIQSMSVDTSETFIPAKGEPSSKAYTQDYGTTSARMEITNPEYKGKILFVWVCIADGAEVLYKMASVVNWYSVYCMAMGYVKTLNCNGCNPPMSFIDFILKTKGIDYALQTGNYQQAITLWNTLGASDPKNLDTGHCGC